MLSPHWFKVVSLSLVIAPHLLLGVLAVVLFKRRLYRDFPCFFTYVVYELAKFLPLFVLYSKQGTAGRLYTYAYCATLLISIALRFGVIDEVAKNLLRDSQLLKLASKRILLGVTGVLTVMGVILAVFPASNYSRVIAGILAINRGAAMVQCGLLLSLLLLSRFVGLSWRRFPLGITLGLGILTSIDLAMFAVRAVLTGIGGREILNLVVTGAYLVCVLVWIGYALAPEASPEPLAAVPHDELETWNREFRQVLRQ